MTSTPPALAAALGLQPHPEGGWFRETFRSDAEVVVRRGSGDQRRSAATLITFLLPAGEASAWHAVASTEIWIWQGPGTITLQLGGDGDHPCDDPVSHRLGGDLDAGELPQLIIQPGVWQRTLPGPVDALAGCLVSPGFDFADFRLAAG
jgi:predicted cupin superfamily sugar epimerase